MLLLGHGLSMQTVSARCGADVKHDYSDKMSTEAAPAHLCRQVGTDDSRQLSMPHAEPRQVHHVLREGKGAPQRCQLGRQLAQARLQILPAQRGKGMYGARRLGFMTAIPCQTLPAKLEPGVI